MVASLIEEVAIRIFPPQKQKSGPTYDCLRSFRETIPLWYSIRQCRSPHIKKVLVDWPSLSRKCHRNQCISIYDEPNRLLTNCDSNINK